MKKTLFILTAMVTVLFSACTEKNKPNSGGGETATEEGALNGIFSVSATKKVYFSQGNLQYQASTKTWRFAERQYDYIGVENENISDTYTGWIDLFFWGTGNCPTLISDNHDPEVFVDWGVNPISNGGNKANQWRTLTKNEYEYLFVNRPDAELLFALGKVRGIKGLILLPDEWNTPKEVTFTPSTQNGLRYTGDYYSNDISNNFSDNTYTAEQWYVMEQAGAIFLPMAGELSGTPIQYNNVKESRYWSATNDDTYTYMGYALSFGSDYLHPKDYVYLTSSFSVRLVQDVK